MKTIQIQNGKAFYDEIQIEEEDEFWMPFYIQYLKESLDYIGNGKYKIKDGTYPLPEGWDVVKYKNLNEFGLFITARLIPKGTTI